MEQSAEIPWSPSPENPVWTIGDVVIISLAFVAFLFLLPWPVVLVASSLPMFRGASTQDVVTNTGVLLSAQILVYIGLLWVIARIVRRRAEHVNRYLDVLSALRWNFPRNAGTFFGIGIILATLFILLAKFLPIPPSLPIDKAFSTAFSAYLMSIFAVAVAPLCEEVFFRGLLYPVFFRSFQRMGAGSAVAASVVATSVLFAALHAPQLDFSPAAVSVIFCVGVVLTLVRAKMRSLASSWLVHVGYNATLLALFFLQTSGFRHLDVIR